MPQGGKAKMFQLLLFFSCPSDAALHMLYGAAAYHLPCTGRDQ
jgi:hypothetical protein